MKFPTKIVTVIGLTTQYLEMNVHKYNNNECIKQNWRNNR